MIGTTGSKSRRQRWLVFGGMMVAMLVAIAVVARLPAAEPATASNPDNSIETVATFPGDPSDIVLDAAGYPVISYYDRADEDLKILHCGDVNCSSGNTITTPDSAGDVGEFASLALDASGFPVVSYHDAGNQDLKLLHCGNPNCTAGNSITSPDTAGQVGWYTSLVLDGSGNPVVAYRDGSPNLDLKVLRCGDAACSSGNTIMSLDTGGNTGIENSLALDSNGFPVVAYKELGAGLKILHCGDATCTSGNSIALADVGAIGNISLVLDGAGNPVVSYERFGGDDGVKVLHCGNANCTSGNTITIIEPGGFFNNTSLALDASGFPVVSYSNSTDDDLKVLHCGNASCTAGNSITTPDSQGLVQSGPMALDGAGNPVIAYRANGDHKVMHCDDPDCFVTKPAATWTPTITPTPTPTITPGPSPTPTPFGQGVTTILMSVPSHPYTCSGPVESPTCSVAAGTTFTVSTDLLNPPAIGYIMAQAFIDYDTNGLVHKKNTIATWPECEPVTFVALQSAAEQNAYAGCLTALFPPQTASFYSGSIYTFELTCTNSHTTSTISLLPSGDPEAGTNGALLVNFGGGKTTPKVGDLTIECVGLPEPGDTDGDGCSDAKEFGLDEALGGRRDYLNPWDYFDVLGPGAALPVDQIIDLPNDILGVIQHFSPSGAAPYDVQFDRGPQIGANVWNMGPPDGVIDLPNDILGVIQQFGHNCQ